MFLYPRQHPGALTRGEARRQQPVIDLPRYGEAVERRWRQVEARVVREAGGGVGDVPLRGGNDPVVISRRPLYLGGIGIEQPLLKVVDLWLERCAALIDIEINLVGEAAGDAALTKFALGVETVICVELVRIARQVGVVTDRLGFVLFAARTRAWNNRLQLADLALLEGVGRLPEIVCEAAGERQFVKRMDPVRALIVEFPIGMHIRLLEGVVVSHALVDRYDVGLHIREVIGRAREVRGATVDSKDVPRNIIAGAHFRKDLAVAL